MLMERLYRNKWGRALLKVLQASGAFRIASWFLRTRASGILVPGYIAKNQIDMAPFKGQRYSSFAGFFARKRGETGFVPEADVLISPCDSRLRVYPVSPEASLHMKGSMYRLTDLIPDKEAAGLFREGLFLVFRLEASDYHHFCSFDDMVLRETHYIPGQLHSVQPIALQTVPVFRLNRRWWRLMHTSHFGTAAQIEIGAMLVGGVSYVKESGLLARGEEMGNFELAGSTIVLLLDAERRQRLTFFPEVAEAIIAGKEVKVTMGEGIGRLI